MVANRISQSEREARLAAKLRENLRRRKEQSRAQQPDGDPPLPKPSPES